MDPKLWRNHAVEDTKSASHGIADQQLQPVTIFLFDERGHTGTSKVLSASLSDVFSSVAAERLPMINAAGHS